jgi:signal peptidase I
MALGPSREPDDAAPPAAPAPQLVTEPVAVAGEPAVTERDPAADSAAPDEDAETPVVAGRSTRPPAKRGGPLGFLRELPGLLLIAFILALLIKTFLVQAFYIPSVSMVPTLQVGDRVLVNKLTYRFHPPGRGDILVFQDPNATPVQRGVVSGFLHWMTDGIGLTTSPEKDFIKRVVGLPGDTVEVTNGVVTINGTRLSPQPYLSPIQDHSDFGPELVPPDELFVMGDNRTNSNDSRGTLGLISYDKIVGRAFVIIWPPSHTRWLSTPQYSSP